MKTSYYPISLAALAAGMLWVNVFALFHPGILAYVGGIPAGISIVWLVVNAANALPRVQSKRARQAGWFFLALVVIVEPVVLWSANYPIVTKTTITPLAANVVSGGASLAITLSLILGALVDRSLIPAEKPTKPTGETLKPNKKPATKPRKVAETVAKQPITDAELVAFFSGNPNATNADAARHFKVSHTAIGKRAKKLFAVKRTEAQG